MIKDLTESYKSLISKYDKGEITLAVVFDEIQKLLKSAEPIRCKDCKYFKCEHYDNGLVECTNMWCEKHYDDEQGEQLTVFLDDYCSFGERRSDGCNCS